MTLAAHGPRTLAAATGKRLAGATAAGLGDADLTAIFAHLTVTGPAGGRPGTRSEATGRAVPDWRG